MTSDPYLSFNLWFETFPGGETARFLVWPRPRNVQAFLFRNQRLGGEWSFGTREEAETWGRELLETLRRDSIVDVSRPAHALVSVPSRLDAAGAAH